MMEDIGGPPSGGYRVCLRALNQAARELLLAQASDWAFMINSGTMEDYASRRIKNHLERFHRLKEQIESAAVDKRWLEAAENENNHLLGDRNFRGFPHESNPFTHRH